MFVQLQLGLLPEPAQFVELTDLIVTLRALQVPVGFGAAAGSASYLAADVPRLLTHEYSITVTVDGTLRSKSYPIRTQIGPHAN